MDTLRVEMLEGAHFKHELSNLRFRLTNSGAEPLVEIRLHASSPCCPGLEARIISRIGPGETRSADFDFSPSEHGRPMLYLEIEVGGEASVSGPLEFGDDDTVLHGQGLLADLPGADLVRDGVFGPRTRAALTRFQHGQRIATHGGFDPETLRCLTSTGRQTLMGSAVLVVLKEEPHRTGPQVHLEIKDSFQAEKQMAVDYSDLINVETQGSRTSEQLRREVMDLSDTKENWVSVPLRVGTAAISPTALVRDFWVDLRSIRGETCLKVITAPRVRFGRDGSLCDVTMLMLPRSAEHDQISRGISREHFEIVVADNSTIRDLGSTMGTWVGGIRIPAEVETPLEQGAEIGVPRGSLSLRASIVRASSRGLGGIYLERLQNFTQEGYLLLRRDVGLSAANGMLRPVPGESGEISLSHDRQCLAVTNTSGLPVAVNGSLLEQGETQPLRHGETLEVDGNAFEAEF